MKNVAFVLVLCLSAACAQPSSSPLSPASAFPSGAPAGANGETLKADAPALVSPVGGIELDDDDPDFEWLNASAKFAAPQVFTYDFEVYEEGERVVALSIPQGTGTTTGFEIPALLDRGENFTWRVRARLGALVGPWSANGSFSTTPLFTCASLGPNPVALIACHRNQFPGHMSKDQLEQVMRGVARDFNRTGVPEDHPWGVLQKTAGNNCNGISCDIICSGNGGVQDQYDVLIDESVPVFGGALDGIRIDVCEYQY